MTATTTTSPITRFAPESAPASAPASTPASEPPRPHRRSRPVRHRARGTVPGAAAARRRTARAAGAVDTPVRLTVRGQVVLVLAVAALALGLSLTFGGGGAIPDGSGSARSSSSVVVQPGQTLWDVATQVAPQADRRAVVDALVRTNRLSADALVLAGQQLVVPQLR